MERPKVLRVMDVFVHVQDLERAHSWYADLLGVEARPADSSSPIRYFDMKDGPGILLDDNRNNTTGAKPLCMLEVPDIEAMHAWAESKNVRIAGGIEEHGNVRFFRFFDPEGNALMAMQKV